MFHVVLAVVQLNNMGINVRLQDTIVLRQVGKGVFCLEPRDPSAGASFQFILHAAWDNKVMPHSGLSEFKMLHYTDSLE